MASWTPKQKRDVLFAHNDAVGTTTRGRRFEFDSEGYWNYLAQEVGKSVAEVQEYWKRHKNYINYVVPVADADAAAVPPIQDAGEEEIVVPGADADADGPPIVDDGEEEEKEE